MRPSRSCRAPRRRRRGRRRRPPWAMSGADEEDRPTSASSVRSQPASRSSTTSCPPSRIESPIAHATGSWARRASPRAAATAPSRRRSGRRRGARGPRATTPPATSSRTPTTTSSRRARGGRRGWARRVGDQDLRPTGAPGEPDVRRERAHRDGERPAEEERGARGGGDAEDRNGRRRAPVQDQDVTRHARPLHLEPRHRRPVRPWSPSNPRPGSLVAEDGGSSGCGPGAVASHPARRARVRPRGERTSRGGRAAAGGARPEVRPRSAPRRRRPPQAPRRSSPGAPGTADAILVRSRTGSVEVPDRPAAFLGRLPELPVGVHRDGIADRGQEREVGDRVRVRVRA